MTYVIRRATLQDIVGIADVAHRTWNVTYAHSIAAHNRQRLLDEAYAPPALGEAITDAQSWFYVAVQPHAVVGFAQYLRRFDFQGELARIYVHPVHHRHGVGRALLVTGLLAMAAAGIEQCYVSVEISNMVARAFYQQFGFRLHRQYARFLGDQIARLVEYTAPVSDLLDAYAVKKTARRLEEPP